MVAGLAVGAGLLLAPLEAAACSCAGGDPWRAYAAADAAMIGVYEGKQGDTTYLFRVVQSFKRTLGPRLAVRSASNGAACGLEVRIGTEVGLYLGFRAGEWHSNLCSQAHPREIRRAAAGLPRPNGEGPVRFLVGGSFGPARVEALDANGRTLAYGMGRGTASALAICSGSAQSVEVVWDDRSRRRYLAVRDLDTLRVARRVRLPFGDAAYASAASCTSSGAYVFAVKDTEARIVRIAGKSVTTIWRGQGGVGTFTLGTAFVGGDRGVVAIDLGNGLGRRVTRYAPEGLPAVSEGGRYLALVNAKRLVRVDRWTGRARVGPTLRSAQGSLLWSGNSIVFLPSDGISAARVYDPALTLRGRFRKWHSSTAVADGRRVVGVSGATMLSARLPRGPVRLLRQFFTRQANAIAAVPAGPRIRTARLSCARG